MLSDLHRAFAGNGRRSISSAQSRRGILPLDVNYPLDRLTFMIEDAGVCLLLTQQAVAASLPQLPLKTLVLDSEWIATNQESLENPVCETSSENLAYLIYTSGSTGRSKGVEISHRALANFSAFAVAHTKSPRRTGSCSSLPLASMPPLRDLPLLNAGCDSGSPHHPDA